MRKAVALDQVLEDVHRVAPERHLRLDPRAVRFARRGRRRTVLAGDEVMLSRWPPLANVPRARSAGGLAIHPGMQLDLPQPHAASEQRLNGDAKM